MAAQIAHFERVGIAQLAVGNGPSIPASGGKIERFVGEADLGLVLTPVMEPRRELVEHSNGRGGCDDDPRFPTKHARNPNRDSTRAGLAAETELFEERVRRRANGPARSAKDRRDERRGRLAHQGREDKRHLSRS